MKITVEDGATAASIEAEFPGVECTATLLEEMIFAYSRIRADWIRKSISVVTLIPAPPPAAEEGFRFEVGQVVTDIREGIERAINHRYKENGMNMYRFDGWCGSIPEYRLEPADDHDPANQATS